MIIVLYVDEILITGSSKKEIASLKDGMNHAFSMINLGLLSQILGLKIAQSQHGFKVHQSKYALDFFNKFNMKYFNSRKTPFLPGVKLEETQSTPLENNNLYRKLVGSLLYLTHNRPDIYYVVSVDSKHMDQPHDIHWMVA